jgi:hypothetical protein
VSTKAAPPPGKWQVRAKTRKLNQARLTEHGGHGSGWAKVMRSTLGPSHSSVGIVGIVLVLTARYVLRTQFFSTRGKAPKAAGLSFDPPAGMARCR